MTSYLRVSPETSGGQRPGINAAWLHFRQSHGRTIPMLKDVSEFHEGFRWTGSPPASDAKCYLSMIFHFYFQAMSAALFAPGIAGSKKARGYPAWQEAEQKDDG
jgi:hypothetical protein